MDARTRWLQLTWPTSNTMAELSICLIVMGAMIIVAVHSFVRAEKHTLVIEAVSVLAGPRTAAMEFHAVTGVWPTSNEQAGYSNVSLVAGGRLSSMVIRDGGAVDFQFSSRMVGLAGKVLSIRAWQGPTTDLPTVWRCGRSNALPLVAATVDLTTLSDDELPSPCRGYR